MKRLLIDGQVFQSAAWDRGMGKYSLSLLEYLLKTKQFEFDGTTILFSANIEIPTEALELVKKSAPQAEIIFLDLQVPADPCKADIPKMQSHNEALLDEYIYKEYKDEEITFLILSLFIDQVCSVFPDGSKKVLLFYDLIPFQYNERYSKLCAYPNYLARFKTLFEADLILTISQTVADDVSINLGINPTKTKNIDGAPVQRTKLKQIKPDIANKKKYILMPSGNDLRKNNIRAVQGFEEYKRMNKAEEISLVITSHFDERTLTNLSKYSEDVIFTGNVAEEELSWLYANAEAILFVPEYEGLGLPILEAAEFNKPIICSNLSVFNEMSSRAFYYCDHLDPLSIGSSINAAINGTEFADKQSEYSNLLKKYTWGNTAKKASEAMLSANISPQKKKQKIAILAPNPSGYSTIGKYVMNMHASLSEYFEIDYYLEDGKTKKDFTRPNYLPYVAKVFNSDRFDRHSYKNYDQIIYHIGNSEFHVDTIKSALYLPGLAIFHDTHLNNIFNGELQEYNYVTKDRIKAEEILDKKLKTSHTSFIASIANNQKDIVVHSEYAEKAVKEVLLSGQTKIAKFNLPVAVPKQSKLKLKSGRITVGFAGIIHPAKGLDVVEEIARNSLLNELDIHIFGLSLLSDADLQRLRSYGNVRINTNVTDFQFQQMLTDLDVLLNYRNDYRGETSAATLEALRYGVLPIVREIGWYSELPNDIALKVKSKDEILRALEQIEFHLERFNPEKAREYVSDEHSYSSYAKNIEKLVDG